MGDTPYNSQRIKGKLRVHQFLSKNKLIFPYLPYTVSFTKQNLEYSLRNFKLLYIKPNVGSQGKGIYQIERTYRNKWKLRSTEYTKSFKDPQSIHFFLRNETHSPLIIQQGIQLEEVNGNPYDIRVMVQRKPGGKWHCTGMFAKVGSPGKIVTNYYQGGQIVSLDEVFSDLKLSSNENSVRYSLLSELSVKVAQTLNSYRKGMHEMGIDYAYDEKGNLWILEVNSRRPQFHPLKKLNPKMYKKMMEFARSYGRKSSI